MRKNVLKEKSFEFSLLVIKVYKELVHKKEFVISKQLLRSATSIGANIVEAQQGVSKKDFIFKLQISLKEAHESWYWLELLNQSNIYYCKELFDLLNEVISLLTKIISTSKKSLRN
jgi:four helix bundle protein